jgi:very-short-patch-repair endonuclease
VLTRLLEKHTFALADSDLERWFIPIALKAGLPKPLTRQWVSGFKVDFYWPDLGLVVETDGGTTHASPIKQTTDRIRDQAHTAAGLTQLRFTHWQLARDRRHVELTLRRVAKRLRAARP